MAHSNKQEKPSGSAPRTRAEEWPCPFPGARGPPPVARQAGKSASLKMAAELKSWSHSRACSRGREGFGRAGVEGDALPEGTGRGGGKAGGVPRLRRGCDPGPLREHSGESTSASRPVPSAGLAPPSGRKCGRAEAVGGARGGGVSAVGRLPRSGSAGGARPGRRLRAGGRRGERGGGGPRVSM